MAHGLPGQEHSRCWAGREETRVGWPWKPHGQVTSPTLLPCRGSLGGAGAWSCAARVAQPGAQTPWRAEAGGRGQHALMRVWDTDSKRCLKLDSDWKPGEPRVFPKGWYFWVGEEFLAQP